MVAPADIEKTTPEYKGGSYEINPTKSLEDGTHRRKSSAVDRDVLTGEVFDDRYESTQRGLKSRHAQMIALGGTIGTGLFVGSGQTLARGGPVFILASYIFMSFLIWCIVTGMTELSAWIPTKGCSMNLFGWRYVSRSLGFAMGWLYFYSLGILVPYEITAAGLVIEYWNAPVNIAVWISIMIVVIVGLNALPVKFYGETEFWLAGLKVIMMIGLLIMSVVLFFGGGPDKDRLGFRYWKNPGAANTYLADGNTGRFIALLSTLVLSAFPFSFAPELLVATRLQHKILQVPNSVALPHNHSRTIVMASSSDHDHHHHDLEHPPPDDWKNSGVRVIPSDSLDGNTPQTRGMDRKAAINFARVGAQKLWAGTVHIHANAKTGAHHHGHLESVIYVLKGKARMRWGDKLQFTAEAGPGDFIYVPPWVPHQEINASEHEKLECVLMRSDSEAVAVNLPDVEPIEAPETVKWIDPTHPE